MKNLIKTIIFYTALIICISSCKPEDVNIIPIKPDYRDSLVGEYPHGLFQAYSCYRDTGYSSIFGVERENTDHILVQKYDTNGLLFIGSTTQIRVENIGQLTRPKIDTGYGDLSGWLYVYLTKDSICLRSGKSVFSSMCAYPYIQITATK